MCVYGSETHGPGFDSPFGRYIPSPEFGLHFCCSDVFVGSLGEVVGTALPCSSCGILGSRESERNKWNLTWRNNTDTMSFFDVF